MNTENPMTELAEAVTPEAPDSLQAWRDAGTALGLLYGQRAARNEAEDAAFEEALRDAAHAQRKDAGLCTCDDVAEKAANIPVKTVTIGVDQAAVEGMLRRLGERARAARVEEDATALVVATTGLADEEPGVAMAAAVGSGNAVNDDV